MLDQHAHPVDPDGVARARERAVSADEAERVASVMTVLADALALRIVAALSARGGLGLVELADAVGDDAPRVAAAVDRLASCGVVVMGGARVHLARREYATLVHALGER